ncbi:MAG: response regulator [Sandaracinaceae bacterium]
MKEQRYSEALALLYADPRPDDREVTRAIETVREAMTQAELQELGSLDGAVSVDALRASTVALGQDEQFLLERIAGRTLSEVIRESTLGRHRTARALRWLLDHRVIRSVDGSGTSARPPAETSIERIVVADPSRTQASLMRTMLRVVLRRSVTLRTVVDAKDLLEVARQIVPDLVVVDFDLPGSGDGLSALAELSTAGLDARAIVVVSPVQAGFVRHRLPQGAAMLVRPVDRDKLRSALGALR